MRKNLTIGILLVVFGHNWFVSHDKGEIFRIIYSFHMPLFFLLSGILMNYNNSLRKTIIKKTDSYLKPYYIACFVAGLCVVLYKEKSLINYLIRIVYGNGLVIPWEWVPLWFLPHIWVVSLFSYLCHRYIDLEAKSSMFRIAFLVGVIVVGYIGIDFFLNARIPGTNILLPGLPLSIDLTLLCSFYFLLGSFLKQSLLNLKFNLFTFITAVLIFCLMHLASDSLIELNLRRYDSIFISTIEALLGIYIIISLSTIIKNRFIISSFFSYIGTASLFIMMFHHPIQVGMFRFVNSMNGDRNIVSALFSFIAAVFFPIMFYELVRKINILEKIFLPIKPAESLRLTQV